MGKTFPMGKRFIKRSENKVMKIDFFTNKGFYIFDIEGIFISERTITIFLTEEKRLDFEKVGEIYLRKAITGREELKEIYIDQERIFF